MRLADLTTLRLGGPARELVRAESEDEIVAAVRGARPPVLVLAGGSNVVVADAGFDGTVVQIATRGVREVEEDVFEVAAGEEWDPLVARWVADGFAGVECLPGIPGSVGATPIQNVGAYGQEVSETIVAVRAYDRRADEVVSMAPAECGFTYRSSAFKRDLSRWVVLAVRFALERSRWSRPVRYAELARTLDVSIGATAPLTDVREAVLALRRSKGMVIDPTDPDSVSAGSFFTNPILSVDEYAALSERVGTDVRLPHWPEPDGRVKTSAAWLIERAGFKRGFALPEAPGVAISDKHTLALTNRGGGTTAALVTLARAIAAGVEREFGVELHPEPVFVGHAW